MVLLLQLTRSHRVVMFLLVSSNHRSLGMSKSQFASRSSTFRDSSSSCSKMLIGMVTMVVLYCNNRIGSKKSCRMVI